MFRLIVSLILFLASMSGSSFAFLAPTSTTMCSNKRVPFVLTANSNSNNDEVVEQKPTFPVGTLVEFTEKKGREHVGKILDVERKTNGSARYDVEEFPTGKHFSIADKEVTFTVPAPNNDKQTEKLLEQLEHAHEYNEQELSQELDITGELLEMAWEEAADDENIDIMSPDGLVELVHSHKPNHIEKYEAWRLLKSEIGHVFFKEMKDHGRVVAFKPKARNSVQTSKDQFIHNHREENDDIWKLHP